jgi:tetratricopeptide (TPR) repeat protein
LEAEQYDTAEEFFDIAIQATEASSKSQTMLSWGLELLLAKQYERAAEVFRRALDEKLAGEREDVCQFYLIRALALAGKTSDALKIAKQAAAAYADSPRIQAQPGWVSYYAKRYADAEKHYVALLKEFDDKHDSTEIRDRMRDARLILSNICVELDRMAEAEEWLEQVLDEFPNDIGALNDLGYLWTEQGKNLNRALDMITRAVDGDPDNVAYIDSLGWVYYQLGRYQEAAKVLEKAVSSAEDPDGVILDHLGDAYIKADQREKAVQTWRKAVESFGKSEDRKRRRITQDKINKHEK